MSTVNMKDFLMENSVHIESEITGYYMIADEMYEPGGEFVVYMVGNRGKTTDLYRGSDLAEAMAIMDGRKEPEEQSDNE